MMISNRKCVPVKSPGAAGRAAAFPVLCGMIHYTILFVFMIDRNCLFFLDDITAAFI